jgi:DNA-binding response OmpR family regulator
MRSAEMNQLLLMSKNPILKRKSLEVLVSAGFQVTDVSDALNGLLMIDKDGFSAVIIDEELADIDGYRACQKVRQYSQIPIILLGTEYSEDVWAKIDELGFDVYLKNPVGPHELVAQIKSVMKRASYEERPKPSQVENPSELRGAPVAPIQEAQPSRLDKIVASEIPDGIERPAEIQSTSDTPLQEVQATKLEKAVEIERSAQLMQAESLMTTEVASGHSILQETGRRAAAPAQAEPIGDVVDDLERQFAKIKTAIIRIGQLQKRIEETKSIVRQQQQILRTVENQLQEVSDQLENISGSSKVP